MALIVSAIANDGILMKPRFVKRVESVDGNVVIKNNPENYRTLMTRTEADQMKNLMEKVVTDGTGSGLYTDWYSAAGKTGSAEYRREDGETGTHSWFVGFSNVDDPDIVVAVIAEDAGAGSTTAVPIAREIFNSYYSS
jgi:peptidoglycan glycosyltransferase